MFICGVKSVFIKDSFFQVKMDVFWRIETFRWAKITDSSVEFDLKTLLMLLLTLAFWRDYSSDLEMQFQNRPQRKPQPQQQCGCGNRKWPQVQNRNVLVVGISDKVNDFHGQNPPSIFWWCFFFKYFLENPYGFSVAVWEQTAIASATAKFFVRFPQPHFGVWDYLREINFEAWDKRIANFLYFNQL